MYLPRIRLPDREARGECPVSRFRALSFRHVSPDMVAELAHLGSQGRTSRCFRVLLVFREYHESIFHEK
jgi:hypothetical protein